MTTNSWDLSRIKVYGRTMIPPDGTSISRQNYNFPAHINIYIYFAYTFYMVYSQPRMNTDNMKKRCILFQYLFYGNILHESININGAVSFILHDLIQWNTYFKSTKFLGFFLFWHVSAMQCYCTKIFSNSQHNKQHKHEEIHMKFLSAWYLH